MLPVTLVSLGTFRHALKQLGKVSQKGKVAGPIA